MSTEGRSLTIPLAVLTGISLGSNPQFLPWANTLFGGRPAGSAPQAPMQAAAAGPPVDALSGRRGAESPELRSLRTAEDEMFPDLPPYAPDKAPYSVAPYAMVPPQAVACDLPRGNDPLASRFGDDLPDDLQTPFGDLRMPDIPVRRHARVLKYVRYFTASAQGRKLFTAWLARSGRYRDIFAKYLGERQLPKDLEAVPFVESGMWPTAVSPAGATGLWQFMPKTAVVYGLSVTPSFDERRSIWRSTEAASEHLHDLYLRFRSWDLALAAYNVGYKRLEERMQNLGAQDFWTLSDIEGALPKETTLYVPKVLAVAVVLNNLSRFGFDDVELDEAIKATALEVPAGVPLSALARAAGTSERTLRELNPELLGGVTPDRGSPVVLHVPSLGAARARVMLPQLLGDEQDRLDLKVSPDFDWGRDELDDQGKSRLERTMQTDPFGVTSAATANGEIRELKLGSPLDSKPVVLEAPRHRAAVGPGASSTTPGSPPSIMRELVYRVRRGDTLTRIAREFGLSQSDLVRDNALNDPSLVRIGQMLRIRPSSDKATEVLRSEQVLRGEDPSR